MYATEPDETRRTNIILAVLYGVLTVVAYGVAYVFFAVLFVFTTSMDISVHEPIGLVSHGNELWMAEEVSGPPAGSTFYQAIKKGDSVRYRLAHHDGEKWVEGPEFDDGFDEMYSAGGELLGLQYPAGIWGDTSTSGHLAPDLLKFEDMEVADRSPMFEVETYALAVAGGDSGLYVLYNDGLDYYSFAVIGPDLNVKSDSPIDLTATFDVDGTPPEYKLGVTGDKQYLFWSPLDSKSIMFAEIREDGLGEADTISTSFDEFIIVAESDRLSLLTFDPPRPSSSFPLSKLRVFEFGEGEWEEAGWADILAMATSGIQAAYHDDELHVVSMGGMRMGWRVFDGKSWQNRGPEMPGNALMSGLITGSFTSSTAFLLPFAVAILAHFHFKSKKDHSWDVGGRVVELASFGRRSVAFIIDMIICYGPFTAWYYYYIFSHMYAFDSMFEDPGEYAKFRAVIMTCSLFLFVVGPLYFFVLEWKFGTTIGKKIMGIRVIRDDGADLGLKEALVRNALRILDFFLYFIPIIVSVAATRKMQRVGDLAARTIVVRE